MSINAKWVNKWGNIMKGDEPSLWGVYSQSVGF